MSIEHEFFNANRGMREARLLYRQRGAENMNGDAAGTEEERPKESVEMAEYRDAVRRHSVATDTQWKLLRSKLEQGFPDRNEDMLKGARDAWEAEQETRQALLSAMGKYETGENYSEAKLLAREAEWKRLVQTVEQAKTRRGEKAAEKKPEEKKEATQEGREERKRRQKTVEAEKRRKLEEEQRKMQEEREEEAKREEAKMRQREKKAAEEREGKIVTTTVSGETIERSPSGHDLIQRALQSREHFMRFFGKESSKSISAKEPPSYNDQSPEGMQLREAVRRIERMDALLKSAEEKYLSVQGSIPDAAMRQRIDLLWNKELKKQGGDIIGATDYLLQNYGSYSLALDQLQREYDQLAETCAKLFACIAALQNAPQSITESYGKTEEKAVRLTAAAGEILRKGATASMEELTASKRDLDALAEELQHIWLNAGADSHARVLDLFLRVSAAETSVSQRISARFSDERLNREQERNEYRKGIRPLPTEHLDTLLRQGEEALAQIQNADANTPLPLLAGALEKWNVVRKEVDGITSDVGIAGKELRHQTAFSYYMKMYGLQKNMEGSEAYWRLRERLLLAKCKGIVSDSAAIPLLQSEFKPEEFRAATVDKLRSYIQRLASTREESAASSSAQQELARLREYHNRLNQFSQFLTSSFSSIGFNEKQVILDLPNELRSSVDRRKADAERILKLNDQAPQDFETLHRALQAVEQTIRRNLSDTYRVSSSLDSYDTAGFMKFSIEEGGTAGKPHTFSIFFERKDGKLTFSPRTVSPFKVIPEPLTPEAVAAHVQHELLNAPSALSRYASIVGIAPDEVKIEALYAGKDRLDFFENNAGIPWDARFRQAAELLQRINAQRQDHPVSFVPFTLEAQFELERLLTLAEQPYAGHILAAVADSTMNLGYPADDPAQRRMTFDVLRDHGILIQVNQSVENALRSGGLRDWETMRSFIRDEWTRLRRKQWESFAKSEEIGEDGKPKTINVLRISVKQFEKQDDAKSVAKKLNEGLHRPGAGPEPAGEGRSIVTEHYANIKEFYADVQRNLRELSGPGKHVVVEITLHGSSSDARSAGHVELRFATGGKETREEMIYSADLLQQIDAVTDARSIYIWSCHGGSHLKQFKRGIGASYAPRNTLAFGDNKVVQGSPIESIIRKATEMQPNGFRTGDTNHDGIVTQNELKEFLNTAARVREGDDPIMFDVESNQMGSTFNPQRSEQIA